MLRHLAAQFKICGGDVAFEEETTFSKIKIENPPNYFNVVDVFIYQNYNDI